MTTGPECPSERARSRRSRSTASCPTRRRWRWSRRAATSSGCACRGPTRPASSGRCSTATRAASAFGPTDVAVPSGRRYPAGTMVLETDWMAQAGWLVVQDALLVGRWHHEHERSGTHRRTPTDYDAAHVLVPDGPLRARIGRTAGRVRARLRLGRTPAEWAFDGPGYGSATATAPDSELRLRLATDLRLGLEGGRARHGSRCAKGTARSQRSHGRSTLSPRPSRTPRSVWRRRRSSGANGSPPAASRTTPGGSTSSGVR